MVTVRNKQVFVIEGFDRKFLVILVLGFGFELLKTLFNFNSATRDDKSCNRLTFCPYLTISHTMKKKDGKSLRVGK